MSQAKSKLQKATKPKTTRKAAPKPVAKRVAKRAPKAKADTYGFELTAILPVAPRAVYDAWMSSDGHAAMTGADASVEAFVGGAFEAWGGYISGRTLALEPGRRIVQTWRTSEFGGGDADSQLEVLLAATRGGTRITLRHSGVPAGQRGYQDGGWEENYFEPMRRFFADAK